MKTVDNLVKRAYDIGYQEAREQCRNVPACRSKAMNELMQEVKNGLLPLIKGYNRGVCDAMSRLAWEALNEAQ